MCNKNKISKLIKYINANNGISNKDKLQDAVSIKFNLEKNKKIYCCDSFSIRFCENKKPKSAFTGTVIALSQLLMYDDLPFIVCLVTPEENQLFLANTTFVDKLSMSKSEISVDNITGSFNGTNILREINGVQNAPKNFRKLFSMHKKVDKKENIKRIVDNTNNIVGVKKKFVYNAEEGKIIRASVDRAIKFLSSKYYLALRKELSNKASQYKKEIALAAMKDNTKNRGILIEYLIASDDNNQKKEIINKLKNGEALPVIPTKDGIGDFEKIFDEFITSTDIKSKLLFKKSAPKGTNIDELLKFLAIRNSVFMIFIVSVDEKGNINTELCSIFDENLLKSVRVEEGF